MAFNLLLLHRTIRAHLSRQILFWVILSLIAVKAIISIPSIYRREKELLHHQHELYRVQLTTLITTTSDLQQLGQRFVQWGKQPELNLVGGKLLNSQAQPLSSFGQTIPEESVLRLPFAQNSTEPTNVAPWIYRDPQARQIEYVYRLSHPQEKLIVVIKQSDKVLRSQLWQYKLGGLGLLILNITLVAFIAVFIDVRLPRRLRTFDLKGTYRTPVECKPLYFISHFRSVYHTSLGKGKICYQTTRSSDRI